MSTGMPACVIHDSTCIVCVSRFRSRPYYLPLVKPISTWESSSGPSTSRRSLWVWAATLARTRARAWQFSPWEKLESWTRKTGNSRGHGSFRLTQARIAERTSCQAFGFVSLIWICAWLVSPQNSRFENQKELDSKTVAGSSEIARISKFGTGWNEGLPK